MIFSSATFLLLFLPIVFILNYFIKNEYSNVFLLIASLFFYAWGEPVLVLVMIVSIVINWGIGRAIGASEGKKKKLILVLGIVCDLGILGYYKYAAFFVRWINIFVQRDIFKEPAIVLPIGISFFTFQAISFIVDVYRGGRSFA